MDKIPSSMLKVPVENQKNDANLINVKKEHSEAKHNSKKVTSFNPVKLFINGLLKIKKSLSKSIHSRKVELVSTQKPLAGSKLVSTQSALAESKPVSTQSALAESKPVSTQSALAESKPVSTQDPLAESEQTPQKSTKVRFNDQLMQSDDDPSIGSHIDEELYNQELKNSRINGAYETIEEKGNKDMDWYYLINDTMKKCSFDKNLIKDKESDEVHEILLEHEIISHKDSEVLKKHNVDLEGSPYW